MRLVAYGALALDHIERRALYADRVDWPATRASMARAAALARTPADLHPVIRAVVRHAGGQHSGLLPPGRPSSAGARQRPSACMVNGHGVLVLPSCPGDVRSVRGYAAAGGQALRRLPPVRGGSSICGATPAARCGRCSLLRCPCSGVTG